MSDLSVNVLSYRAFEKMAALKIEPTPQNYEIFFRLAEGKNIKLDQAINQRIEDSTISDISVLDSIYAAYIAPVVVSDAMDTLSEQLSESVGKVFSITKEAATDTASFGESLGDFSTIASTTQDPGAIAEAVSSILKSARQMAERNNVTSAKLSAMEENIESLHRQLVAMRNESMTDSLTNVWNRRYLSTTLHETLADSDRNGKRFFFCMADVDHFKAFNDKWGHLVGDSALQHVASIFKAVIGDKGYVCRYGGEEFAIVLNVSDHSEAKAIFEEARVKLSEKSLIRKETRENIGNITASLGVVASYKGAKIDDLYARADKLLYEAKGSGRNKVVTSFDDQMDVGNALSAFRKFNDTVKELSDKDKPAPKPLKRSLLNLIGG